MRHIDGQRRRALWTAVAVLVLAGVAGCSAATREATAPAPGSAAVTTSGTVAAVPTTADGTAATPSALDPSDFDGAMARTQQVADDIVGKTEHDAEQSVRAAGLQWRVGQRDGESFPLTMDLRPDRITVVVDEGRVTKATAG